MRRARLTPAFFLPILLLGIVGFAGFVPSGSGGATSPLIMGGTIREIQSLDSRLHGFHVTHIHVGSPSQPANAAAFGDFNGDGLLDVAVAVSGPSYYDSGTMQLYLSQGDGRYIYSTSCLIKTPYPRGIVTADFNGDGYLDAATPDGYICTGDKEGLLDQNLYFPAVGDSIVTTDFNNDGIPDIAVANSTTNTVSITLGGYGGAFQAANTYATGAQPYWLVSADFNNDGIPDLAVVNKCGDDTTCRTYSGTVSVFLGNGDGTFQPPIESGVGAAPVGIVAADFNHDGNMDIATADSCGLDASCLTFDGEISVLFGDGNGHFNSRTDYSTGEEFTVSLAVGKIDGDSNPDLVVANEFRLNCNDCNTGDISLFLGKRDGTFQAPKNLTQGGPELTFVAVEAGQNIVSANNGINGVYGNKTGVTIFANLGGTSLTLTSSLNPSRKGQPVIFTSSVNPTVSGQGIPTGTVTFYGGATKLGTATLDVGVGSLTVSTLSLGSYPVYATYSGDDSYYPNNSETLVQVVKD